MENNSRIDFEQKHFIEDLVYHFSEWFRRLWIIILIFAVLAAGLLVLYTYITYVPQYSASATFTVNVDVAKSSAQQYNKATANQLAKTFPNILTSGSLNKVVCRDLGVDSISETITASVVEDTNLFTITVNSTNPQRAYNVLASVINNYPEVAKFIIGSTQLSLIDTSSVSTVPINYPNYASKAVMGSAVGAIAGLLVIVLLSLATSTIIRGSDISEAYNTVCLGSVPEYTRKKRSKDSSDKLIPNVEDKNSNYKFKEGIFTLRNSVIRRCKEEGFKSVVVTSTISGEGKSVIAANLARAIAVKGYNTVLVDFDFRVPSIAEYMKIDNDVNSVSDYVRGKVDLNHCVYSTHSKNLYVAVEKKNNADAAELVGSDGAKRLIEELSKIFEFVIIDAPPIGYLSDAAVIGDYADAVLYVVAQDIVSRRNIGEGLSTFDNLNAKVIGAVLNRITKGIESISYGRYGYRKYGYSRYSRHTGKYNTGKYDSEVNDKNRPSSLETLNKNGIVFEDE